MTNQEEELHKKRKRSGINEEEDKRPVKKQYTEKQFKFDMASKTMKEEIPKKKKKKKKKLKKKKLKLGEKKTKVDFGTNSDEISIIKFTRQPLSEKHDEEKERLRNNYERNPKHLDAFATYSRQKKKRNELDKDVMFQALRYEQGDTLPSFDENNQWAFDLIKPTKSQMDTINQYEKQFLKVFNEEKEKRIAYLEETLKKTNVSDELKKYHKTYQNKKAALDMIKKLTYHTLLTSHNREPQDDVVQNVMVSSRIGNGEPGNWGDIIVDSMADMKRPPKQNDVLISNPLLQNQLILCRINWGIQDMDWLHRKEGNKEVSYIAMACYNPLWRYENHHLYFQSKKQYRAPIIIWRVEFINNEPTMRLYGTFEHQHGSCLKLKWIPFNTYHNQKKNSLGMLVAVYMDGTFGCHHIPMLKEQTTFYPHPASIMSPNLQHNLQIVRDRMKDISNFGDEDHDIVHGVPHYVTCLDVSKNGQYLLLGDSLGSVSLYQLFYKKESSRCQLIAYVPLELDLPLLGTRYPLIAINDVAFCEEDHSFTVAHADGFIRNYQIDDVRIPLFVYQKHLNSIVNMKYPKNSLMVMYIAQNKIMNQLNPIAGTMTSIFFDKYPILSSDIHQSNSCVVFSNEEGSVFIKQMNDDGLLRDYSKKKKKTPQLNNCPIPGMLMTLRYVDESKTLLLDFPNHQLAPRQHLGSLPPPNSSDANRQVSFKNEQISKVLCGKGPFQHWVFLTSNAGFGMLVKIPEYMQCINL